MWTNVSLGNDSSEYIFCRRLLKLLSIVLSDVADTVSSSSLFHTLMILSVKKCCRRSVLIHYVCEVSGCVLLFDRGDKIRKISEN